MKANAARRPVIGIDGLGYMGLATALSFAAKGWHVIGYDIEESVRGTINEGRSQIKERGFEAAVTKHRRNGRLRVAESLVDLVRQAEVIFICLPTPQGSKGRIDLAAIKSGVRDLGTALRDQQGYRLVVVKSTVVPGTTLTVIEPSLRKFARKDSRSLGVAASPEFLAEGSALRDASRPERIVIGTTDARASEWLRRAYQPFRAPIFELDPVGAELVKYSSNAFLAIKVSFANEISRLTEKLAVNIDDVMQAVGRDSRIGQRFLRAGPGFGGSCFEKDLRALIAYAEDLGVALRIERAALKVNEEQVAHVVSLIRNAVGQLNGKRIAFLGLAFKAGTDDVRESRAFPIIRFLIQEGARVRAHDPAALANFRREWRHLSLPGWQSVTLCESLQSALRGVSVVILHTDWPLYRGLSIPKRVEGIAPVVIDTRRYLPRGLGVRSGAGMVRLGDGVAPPPEGIGASSDYRVRTRRH